MRPVLCPDAVVPCQGCTPSSYCEAGAFRVALFCPFSGVGDSSRHGFSVHACRLVIKGSMGRREFLVVSEHRSLFLPVAEETRAEGKTWHPECFRPRSRSCALCMAMLCASSYQVCEVWRGDRQLLLSRKRRAEVGFKAATPLALGSAPYRAQVPRLPAACRRLGAKAAKSSEIHRYQAPRPERQRPCGRSSRPAVGQRLRKARLGDGLTFLLQTRSRCRKAIREARGRGGGAGG